MVIPVTCLPLDDKTGKYKIVWHRASVCIADGLELGRVDLHIDEFDAHDVEQALVVLNHRNVATVTGRLLYRSARFG